MKRLKKNLAKLFRPAPSQAEHLAVTVPVVVLEEPVPEPPAPAPTLWEKVKPYTFCGEE